MPFDPVEDDLPTLAETVPGLYANAWYGLFAPKGTPAAVETQGLVIAPSTPQELATLLQSDLVRWAKIVKDSGARPE